MFFVAELASTYSRDFSQETLYYLIGKDRWDSSLIALIHSVDLTLLEQLEQCR